MITQKMADQGRSDFYVAFTVSFFALELKQTSTSLLFQAITAVKLGIHALRSFLNVICEQEFHILPNRKVGAAKHHGKNYTKVRPPPVRHI